MQLYIYIYRFSNIDFLFKQMLALELRYKHENMFCTVFCVFCVHSNYMYLLYLTGTFQLKYTPRTDSKDSGD